MVYHISMANKPLYLCSIIPESCICSHPSIARRNLKHYETNENLRNEMDDVLGHDCALLGYTGLG